MFAKAVLAFILCFCCAVHAKPVLPVILVFRTAPPTQAELQYIERVNPFGFLLFAKEMNAAVPPIELKKDIERRLKRKVYFFIDQEGGSVNRLKDPFPSARAFGRLAADDPKEAAAQVQKTAYEMGRRLKENGIDFVFAPVLDVGVSKSDFLNTRTYADTPKTVSLLAGAFTKGMHQAGIQTCPKHAPGIGRSVYDPHENKARISTPLDELKAHDFYPFYQNTDSCLMTGHIFYQAIDAETVSTFSPVFYRFIRNELNFNGWIIPDALNMKGLGEASDTEKITKALTAGADIVMPFFGPEVSFSRREAALKAIPADLIQRFQSRIP